MVSGVREADGGEDGVATRWVWTAAWPVTAVFVLSNAATPLYVRWQRDIGFSKGTLTVIFACYIVGLLGSLLVSGVVSDRVGRKPVLLPALGLALAACAIFASASSVAALLVARLFSGIAVGAVVSAGMAAVTDVAGPGRRRLAALLASCAMVFGAGLGPLLAGVLGEGVFALEAVLLVAAVLVVVRMPLRGSSGVPARSASAPSASAPSASAPSASARSVLERSASARSVPASRAWVRIPGVPRGSGGELLMGIAVFAPGITATSFVLSLGPSLLSGLLHTTSPVVAGAMAFVMFLTATGAQFAVQRLDRRTILLAGAVSTTIGMGALIAAVRASSVPLLVAAALLAARGRGWGSSVGCRCSTPVFRRAVWRRPTRRSTSAAMCPRAYCR
ncbi:MFS transporter [Streptomyces indonesiensis]